jgi:hypothetical protein
VGALSTTTFNGKFETNSVIYFHYSGSKVFRDGLGGAGTIYNYRENTPISGLFQITGSNAIIDGSVKIILTDNPVANTNELEITSTASVTITGNPVIAVGTSGKNATLQINGSVINNSNASIDLTYGSLLLNGQFDLSGSGSIKGSSVANLKIGNTSGNAGLIKFAPGFQLLDTLTVNRQLKSFAAVLGSNLTVNSLVLQKGIISTGNNLLTWNNTGTLTLPAAYTDSYICLCDATGTNPISFTKPFDGSKGFRINNVRNTDTYFPVGVDFVSPNRMMLNIRAGSSDDITVAMEKGDIGGTEQPRVNRIWYVKQSDPSRQINADVMKLFFTHRDQSEYLESQDEVETDFNYGNIHLIQKAYDDPNYLNVSSGSDVISFPPSPELYAKYTYGVSPNVYGSKNGIDTFTRFSIMSLATNYILPVTLINFNAYISEKSVKTEWTSMNEANVEYYEIERAAETGNFTIVGTVKGKNNANEINYVFYDANPYNGTNLYRIKAVDRNGKFSYSQVVSVNFKSSMSYVLAYPNPSKNHQFSLQLKSVPTGTYRLQLFSLNGALVFIKTINYVGSSSQLVQLPSAIKPGVYLLRLSSSSNYYNVQLLLE